MRIMGFGTNAVTLELDRGDCRGDCLALAEACRQTVRHDAATDTDRTDLTVGELREAWLRPDPLPSPRPPREAGE